MVNEEFDVVVVGAGPGGSIAARFASAQGLKVALLGKRKMPGLKVCAGGLTDKVMREFDVSGEAIECVVKNFLFYTPKTLWYSVPVKGAATTYRTTIENASFKRLDYQLAMMAEREGAKLFTLSDVRNMAIKNHRVKLLVKTSLGDRIITSKILIGADGFNSIIAKSVGLWRPYKKDEMVVAVQREVLLNKRNEDENCYHIYDEEIAKVGYAWIYPKSRGFTIGLGCLASYIVEPLEFTLERMIKTNPVVKKIITNECRFMPIEGAIIPVNPLKNIYSDNVMLIGDAARHVNPLTWGGIYNAMVDGKIASEIAVEAISVGDYSKHILRSYQEKWHERLGERLIWEREKFSRVSEKFVKYFEMRISLLKNPFARCLVNITSRTPIKFAKLIPPLLLDNLIMYNLI